MSDAATGENAIAPLAKEDARAFGRSFVEGRHALHETVDWSDAALARILDDYPRERLEVFTMGEDPVDWRSWRRGEAGALSGARLVELVHEQRIWLNLRAANTHLPEFADMTDAIFSGLRARGATARSFKRDLGVLISAPRAQVFYHLDVAMVALFHMRGRKRFYLYDVAEPFVTADVIEQVVLRETAEQFAYDPCFDAQARVLDLAPGDWTSWPQNAPHRIVNGDDLNVSLSIEYLTPRALVRASEIYANGVLRRRFGLKPGLSRSLSPVSFAKAGFARAWKLTHPEALKPPLPATFELDGGVEPL